MVEDNVQLAQFLREEQEREARLEDAQWEYLKELARRASAAKAADDFWKAKEEEEAKA